MSIGTLETIGYSEPDAAQHIAAFLAQPRTGLVDIRYSPYCRWEKQWNTSAFQARYGNKKYIHPQCAGLSDEEPEQRPAHHSIGGKKG